MKSGAEVLVVGVKVEEALVVPFPFTPPGRSGLCFVVVFFFATPDVGILADGFLARVFLLPAMAGDGKLGPVSAV